jgi:hypothetical protein
MSKWWVDKCTHPACLVPAGCKLIGCDCDTLLWNGWEIWSWGAPKLSTGGRKSAGYDMDLLIRVDDENEMFWSELFVPFLRKIRQLTTWNATIPQIKKSTLHTNVQTQNPIVRWNNHNYVAKERSTKLLPQGSVQHTKKMISFWSSTYRSTVVPGGEARMSPR